MYNFFVMGDIDKDGVLDIGFNLYPRINFKGRFEAYSGRTFQRLYKIDYGKFTEFYNFNSFESVGDVDSDGTPDFLGLQPDLKPTFLFSGKTGKLIRKVYPPLFSQSFGRLAAGGQDLDGDGVPDYLIADQDFGGRWNRYRGYGKVFLYSGKTGQLILGFYGTKVRGIFFGVSLALLGDLNGDGVCDVGVGEFGAGANSQGSLWVFSGKHLGGGLPKLLFKISGTQKGERFAWALSPCGDWNGDRVQDFAVGHMVPVPSQSYLQGEILVYSGKSRKILAQLRGKQQKALDAYGYNLRSIGDLDQDGIPELLVGTLSPFGANAFRDYFDVWSAKTHPLRASLPRVSLSGNTNRGGLVQTLYLDAGPSNAGKPYLMLGSASGVRPGTRLGRHHLPLNLDFYTQLSWSYPRTMFFPDGVGVLDAKGKAKAHFTLPLGLPASLRWTVLDHAFVVWDGGGVRMVSNAVPVYLDR